MNRPESIRKLSRRTAAHYDAHPFDFLTAEHEAALDRVQSAGLIDFIGTYLRPGAAVAEIGCGSGRASMYLARQNCRTTAVDISAASLARARQRAPRVRFIRADNLALPFADREFDAVISDGVIHHTPDARRAFAENVRILKSGGYYYLGVYDRRDPYYYLYNYLGAPIRKLERSAAGRTIVHATVLPAFYAAQRVIPGGARSWRGARNLYYDYFVTPRATFHSYEEIAGWAEQHALDILGYDPSPRDLHVFVLRKR